MADTAASLSFAESSKADLSLQDEEKAGPSVSPTIIDKSNNSVNTIISSNKTQDQFRNYENGHKQSKVSMFYYDQHLNQTYDFVVSMESKYFQLNHFKMSVWDCLLFLDSLVDDSDPDTENSQLQHALQTAEAIRKNHPDKDWMQLTGLIHDLGKILSIACKEPQWAVVGDSFPVGCQFSDQSVFADSFRFNPDSQHPVYSSLYGLYSPHCGLSAIKMSFGHDEYLYRVLIGNEGVKLPVESLAMIRFHSFYPWHSKQAYSHLTNEEDDRLLSWVKLFNQFDLYSKDAEKVDVEAVKPYYLQLISKYLPETLKW